MEKFLIADDHPLFREALKGALEPLFNNAKFVESDSLESTLSTLESNPDISLILLDLNMPGCENFYGLLRVTGDFPNTPAVVISASDSGAVISHAMGMGASAFIPKSSATMTIAEAIKTVMSGEKWLPVGAQDGIDAISEEQLDIAKKIATLTPKQFQVLKYLQSGKLNKQIAYDMNVTEATIKAHISAIFKKFNVNTRTQAVLLVEKLQNEI